MSQNTLSNFWTVIFWKQTLEWLSTLLDGKVSPLTAEVLQLKEINSSDVLKYATKLKNSKKFEEAVVILMYAIEFKINSYFNSQFKDKNDWLWKYYINIKYTSNDWLFLKSADILSLKEWLRNTVISYIDSLAEEWKFDDAEQWQTVLMAMDYEDISQMRAIDDYEHESSWKLYIKIKTWEERWVSEDPRIIWNFQKFYQIKKQRIDYLIENWQYEEAVKLINDFLWLLKNSSIKKYLLTSENELLELVVKIAHLSFENKVNSLIGEWNLDEAEKLASERLKELKDLQTKKFYQINNFNRDTYDIWPYKKIIFDTPEIKKWEEILENIQEQKSDKTFDRLIEERKYDEAKNFALNMLMKNFSTVDQLLFKFDFYFKWSDILSKPKVKKWMKKFKQAEKMEQQITLEDLKRTYSELIDNWEFDKALVLCNTIITARINNLTKKTIDLDRANWIEQVFDKVSDDPILNEWIILQQRAQSLKK